MLTDRVEKKAEALPCPDANGSLPPPLLNLSATEAKHQWDIHPLFDRLRRRNGSVGRIAFQCCALLVFLLPLVLE